MNKLTRCHPAASPHTHLVQVVEGVHLSINFVIKLMQRHPTVLPFLVFINSETKHVERMAVCVLR